MFSRQVIRTAGSRSAVRSFTSTAAKMNQPTVVVTPKKVRGGYKKGFVGFLLGASVSGVFAYYYLLEEFKTANSLIVADVVALQESIAKLEAKIDSKK